MLFERILITVSVIFPLWNVRSSLIGANVFSIEENPG